MSGLVPDRIGPTDSDGAEPRGPAGFVSSLFCIREGRL